MTRTKFEGVSYTLAEKAIGHYEDEKGNIFFYTSGNRKNVLFQVHKEDLFDVDGNRFAEFV